MRIFRSEMGCQFLETLGSTGCFSKPWMGGSSDRPAVVNPKPAVTQPNARRNERRVPLEGRSLRRNSLLAVSRRRGRFISAECFERNPGQPKTREDDFRSWFEAAMVAGKSTN